MLMAAVMPGTGCSSKSENVPQPSIAKAGNVALSAAQRQNIRLYTVATSKFHKTIEITGIVDFDNDQATGVLAPFSGPVSRLVVSLGDQVKKGGALAEVDSPDFAAAIGAYRKALATAKTNRRLADLDKDLIEHHGIAQREADQAETDAVKAQTIKDIQQGRPIPRAAGIIRSPVAGTVVERLITPGELLQAGTTPCFTVANLSRVWVMAQLFGSDLASVNLGDSAQVLTATDSKSYSGRVD